MPVSFETNLNLVLLVFHMQAEAISVRLGEGTLDPGASIGDKFKHGDEVTFEVTGGKAMKLVVMSPLELGEKLTDLEIKDDWTVGPAVLVGKRCHTVAL